MHDGRKIDLETTTLSALDFAAPGRLCLHPRTTAYSSPFRLHAERKDGGEEPEEELELRHSSETARSSEGRR